MNLCKAMWHRWNRSLFAVIVIAVGLTETLKPSKPIEEFLKSYLIRDFPQRVPKNIHNTVAEEWLHQFNAVYRWLLQTNAEIDWAYRTNITFSNSRNLRLFCEFKEEVLHHLRTEATRFRLPWLNLTIARQLRAISRKFDGKPSSFLKQKVLQKQMRLVEIYDTRRVDIRDRNYYSGETDIARLMRDTRDPNLLLKAWNIWYDGIDPLMRKEYLSFIRLQNNLANIEGYSDMGMFWKVKFDPDVDVEAEMELLWQTIKPLYEQLHAFVRTRLSSHYGIALVDPKEALPVHLLGNLWAQEWESIIDICTPYPQKYHPDATTEMQRRNWTVTHMFHLAESFFTSLGLERMTDQFWLRSMFAKPSDGRLVDCHAASTNFFDGKDYRIRMCTQVTMNDLNVIQHEMGHIQYFMAFRDQPPIFQEGASQALHESIGDTIQYSFLTHGHLKEIGLIPKHPQTNEEDINFLMKMALLKIPLIPHSLVMDKWRWQLFRHDINATNMNENWWKLRWKYQGVKPPSPRSEWHFDPGGKYHIPHNIPYIGYFYSCFLQVQLHKQLCLQKSNNKMIPLHRCNIFGSKNAGSWLKKILSLGSSQPWKTILNTFFAGQVSASELMEYYAPLHRWLVKENKRNGATIGWIQDIKGKI